MSRTMGLPRRAVRALAASSLVGLLGASCGNSNALAATQVVAQPLHTLTEAAIRRAPAQVINEQQARVSAQLSGRVEQVMVQVGEQVSAGQALVRLECADQTLALAQVAAQIKALQSELMLADAQLRRLTTLRRQQHVSAQQLEQQQAQQTVLNARLSGQQVQQRQARLQVQRCTVAAPFTGIISARLVAPGSWVTSGTPVLQLLDQNAAEVSAELLPEELSMLQQAVTVRLRVGNSDYPLALRASVPLVQGSSRTQPVRLRFTGPPALSGAVGELIWQAPSAVLPPAYLVQRNGQLGVMTAEQERARFIALPDARSGQAAAIDLPADTLIVVQGQHALQDGMTIRVQEAADADPTTE